MIKLEEQIRDFKLVLAAKGLPLPKKGSNKEEIA